MNTTLSRNSLLDETTSKPIDFQTKEESLFVVAPLMKSDEFVSTKEKEEKEFLPQINSQNNLGLNGVVGNAIFKVTKEIKENQKGEIEENEKEGKGEKVAPSFSQILFNLLNETLSQTDLASETNPEKEMVQENYLKKVFDDFMSTKSLKSIIENDNLTFENEEKEYFDLSALKTSVQNVVNLTETDFEKPFHQLLFESFSF